jgi:hypothetical protein
MIRALKEINLSREYDLKNTRQTNMLVRKGMKGERLHEYYLILSSFLVHIVLA